MRLLVTCALIACFTFSLGQSDAESWARYRVWAETPEEVQRIADSDLGVYSEHVGTVTDLIVKHSELGKLRALGLRYAFISVLSDPRNWADRYVWTQNYRTGYLRYDQIIAQCEVWRLANPKFLSRTRIGTSVQNRPIWMYKVSGPTRSMGGSDNRKQVVVIGGMHAREWISPPVTMYMLENLLARARVLAPIRELLGEYAVYFVPVLNPDGYEFTWTNNRYWRKNRRNNGDGTRGVDLNRNFSKGWGGSGSSGNTGSDTYRGPSAFSEPETVAIRDAVQAMPNVKGFLDMHSYSQLVLYPWGYTESPPPDRQALHDVGEVMREGILSRHGKNYVNGQCSIVLYLASGISVDWAYDRNRAFAYTLELRDTGQYGFELPPSQIIPNQEEMYEGFERYLLELRFR